METSQHRPIHSKEIKESLPLYSKITGLGVVPEYHKVLELGAHILFNDQSIHDESKSKDDKTNITLLKVFHKILLNRSKNIGRQSSLDMSVNSVLNTLTIPLFLEGSEEISKQALSGTERKMLKWLLFSVDFWNEGNSKHLLTHHQVRKESEERNGKSESHDKVKVESRSKTRSQKKEKLHQDKKIPGVEMVRKY